MKKADLYEIFGVVFTLTALLYFSFPIMATAFDVPCEQYTNTGFAITAFFALIAGVTSFGSADY